MKSRSHAGQASVELALALPLLAVWLLAVVQLVLIVRDQLAVLHAAREGARAAAVSTSPASAAQQAAQGAISIRPLNVSTSAGSTIRVRVTTTSRTDVPFVGMLLPDVELSGSASMRAEP